MTPDGNVFILDKDLVVNIYAGEGAKESYKDVKKGEMVDLFSHSKMILTEIYRFLTKAFLSMIKNK